MQADVPVFGKGPYELARAINGLLADDFRKEVVVGTLAYRFRASELARIGLGTHLDGLAIPGHKLASRAPIGRLIGPVDAASRKSGPLLAALLEVWVEAKSALAERVEMHLLSDGIDVPSDVFPEMRLRGFWSLDGWDGHSAELMKSAEELSLHEVQLMLCCVAGRAPVSLQSLLEVKAEWERQKDEAALPDLLASAYEHLECLPADAEGWHAFRRFSEAAYLLQSKKASEKEMHLARSEARSVLENLKQSRSEELAYLGLDAVRSWTIGEIGLAEARDVGALLVQLWEWLAQHAVLRKSVADTLAAEGPRAAEIEDCRDVVNQLVEALSFKLSDGVAGGKPKAWGGGLRRAPTMEHEGKPSTPAEFEVLRVARRFALGGIGLDGRIGREEEALSALLREQESLRLLSLLLEMATTEGKLYALAGLRVLDYAKFGEVVESVSFAREDVVAEANGCVISTCAAEKVLERIRQGAYDGHFDRTETRGPAIAASLNREFGVWEGRILPLDRTKPVQPTTVIGEASFVTSLKPILKSSSFVCGTEEHAAEMIGRYWEAVQRVFPEAFVKADDYVIQDEPGVFSLHGIAPDVFELASDRGDLGVNGIYAIIQHLSVVDGGSRFWEVNNGEGAASYSGMNGFARLASHLRQLLPGIKAR
jgi:hypothetical protein